MKIEIAEKAGFCFGVRRAIERACRAKDEAGQTPVYTLGPLVHNPQVIDNLRQNGIVSIDDPGDRDNRGILLIRTHGISPSIREKAQDLGYEIIDATCPLVQKIHKIVRMLEREKYSIIVIGHASHPEVQGIVGEVEGDCLVIENPQQAAQLGREKKLGVVVQTTALLKNYRKIASQLVEKAEEVRIFNTICYATYERQKAAEKLANRSSVMIVVGGKNSSNTRRLLEICKMVNPNSYHVETALELKEEWFEKAERVGITAGASTPDYIIDQVRDRIEQLGKDGNHKKTAD